MHAYIHTYIHINIHAYKYTYIHTYTHTHKPSSDMQSVVGATLDGVVYSLVSSSRLSEEERERLLDEGQHVIVDIHTCIHTSTKRKRE